MIGKKEYSDIFDDDFEVTYEDESGMTVDITSGSRQYDRKNTRPSPSFDDTSALDDYDHDDYDDHVDYRYNSREDKKLYGRTASQRKKGRRVHLAAPIRKGGRTLSRLTAAVVHVLTVVLILVILVYVCWTFWRASTPYGDIMDMIRTQQLSVTLAAYLCVAALFVLFELIALFWSMTKTRVRNGLDSWYEDNGRGLFSFLFVFATSYLAFLLSPFIPEAPEAVYGVKGALEVYGSMHNVLFGLCIAGIISCIVRKYFA